MNARVSLYDVIASYWAESPPAVRRRMVGFWLTRWGEAMSGTRRDEPSFVTLAGELETAAVLERTNARIARKGRR